MRNCLDSAVTPRMCCDQAQALLVEAASDCSIPSLAQVIVAIDEDGHRDLIVKFLCENGTEKFKQAIKMIRLSTQIRI